ncbi:MAG: glycosyltransferase family 2 protein [Rhizobacter sp.]
MATHQVIAVVVTYKPNTKVFSQLRACLAPQVQHIVIVDNTEGSSAPDRLKSSQETWLRLGRNTGIAHAQNLGIDHAKRLGATHILLMDQDSLPPMNMVQCQLDTLACEPSTNVAAIGPLCRDVKTGNPSLLIQRRGWRIFRMNAQTLKHPVPVEYMPASGTLIPLPMLERIGPMRTEYFIDRVDVEWCLRARHLGMSIWVNPCTVMQHNQGTSTMQILGRTLYMGQDFRGYFHVRNSIAMALRARVPLFWRIDNLLKTLPCMLLYPLRAKTGRLRVAGILLRAVFDGFLGRMGKGYYRHRPLD